MRSVTAQGAGAVERSALSVLALRSEPQPAPATTSSTIETADFRAVAMRDVLDFIDEFA